MYEKGIFRTTKSPSKLIDLFGAQKKGLSIEALQKIEKTLEIIRGTDCAACGAPDCQTFAEDVVRGNASLKQCLWLSARGKNNSKRKDRS
jgi:Na+-translocating ferredoxin:NAD+ oxidoreductase RNF subunit RnfB